MNFKKILEEKKIRDRNYLAAPSDLERIYTFISFVFYFVYFFLQINLTKLKLGLYYFNDTSNSFNWYSMLLLFSFFSFTALFFNQIIMKYFLFEKGNFFNLELYLLIHSNVAVMLYLEKGVVYESGLIFLFWVFTIHSTRFSNKNSELIRLLSVGGFLIYQGINSNFSQTLLLSATLLLFFSKVLPLLIEKLFDVIACLQIAIHKSI